MIVPEAVAQKLWAKVKGIAKRLMHTLQNVPTSHEHLYTYLVSQFAKLN
jgi:hypothetical protein